MLATVKVYCIYHRWYVQNKIHNLKTAIRLKQNVDEIKAGITIDILSINCLHIEHFFLNFFPVK